MTGICASCAEGEHDTCLRLLREHACTCSCPIDGDLALDQPPPPPRALIVLLGPTAGQPHRPHPPGRLPVPPWPPGLYCGYHHLIDGDNAYYDAHQRRWHCRRCRRDAWRRSAQRRREQARTEAVT